MEVCFGKGQKQGMQEGGLHKSKETSIVDEESVRCKRRELQFKWQNCTGFFGVEIEICTKIHESLTEIL